MKSLLKIALFFIVVMSLTNCNKEDYSINESKVQFSLIIAKPSQKSSLSNKAKSIVVSITDNNGLLVYDTEIIELTDFNGSYISKPLSLKTGNYKLTQFHVVDAGGNVIFSTPIKGSKMAYLVLNPLPIDFVVQKDKVTKLSPEVISIENTVASDFGYSTFSFNLVKTFDFLISVFIYNPIIQNYELTNAKIIVSGNEPFIFEDSLKAITNQITVREGSIKYTIQVTKSLYKTYSSEFSTELLKAMINNPLKIILEKEISIPGLVAHYPFNGNVNDESGNGRHGIDFGASVYNSGILNMARYFSNDPTIGLNSTDYATIPNVINSIEFSISLWAKFGHSDTHQSLIYLSPGDDWVAANFWLAVSPDMKLGVKLNGLDLRTIDYSHNALINNQLNDAYKNSKPLDLDKYYNISCTFKSSIFTLYVNGLEYAKYINVNKAVGTPDVPIKIGVCPRPGMLYYPFVGQMDELRFYNRALNLDEINLLYNL